LQYFASSNKAQLKGIIGDDAVLKKSLIFLNIESSEP